MTSKRSYLERIIKEELGKLQQENDSWNRPFKPESWAAFYHRIENLLPVSSIEQSENGAIVIHTNLMIDDSEMVVPYQDPFQDKFIQEVAPPGREDQVKKLKKELPKTYKDASGKTKESNPWAVAWANYNKEEKK